jgi:hypothetical protein
MVLSTLPEASSFPSGLMQTDLTVFLCANNAALAPALFSPASVAAPGKPRRLIVPSGIMISACSHGSPLTRARWNEGLLLSVFMVIQFARIRFAYG